MNKTKIIINYYGNSLKMNKEITFFGNLSEETINDLTLTHNICITMKKQNDDNIIDFYFEKFKWSFQYFKKDSILYILVGNGQNNGIFQLITWLHADLNRIIDVANKYDGKVLTHNNSKSLFLHRINDVNNKDFKNEFIFITYHK
jgi:hypothetical protein